MDKLLISKILDNEEMRPVMEIYPRVIMIFCRSGEAQKIYI